MLQEAGQVCNCLKQKDAAEQLSRKNGACREDSAPFPDAPTPGHYRAMTLKLSGHYLRAAIVLECHYYGDLSGTRTLRTPSLAISPSLLWRTSNT